VLLPIKNEVECEMKNDISHKKSVLNFNANEWVVERPAQRIKPVVTNQINNSQVNTNTNNVSVPMVDSGQNKEKNPVLIAIIVALVVILFAFAAIIISKKNSACIDIGQVVPISYIEAQFRGVLGNLVR